MSEQRQARTYFVRITGHVYVEARSREEAMRMGRAALGGETSVDPHIELGVTDAWYAGERKLREHHQVVVSEPVSFAALRDAAQAVLETFDSGRAVQVPDEEPCPELDALRAALAASPASSGPGLLERAARRSRDGAGLASPEGLGISEEERHG